MKNSQRKKSSQFFRRLFKLDDNALMKKKYVFIAVALIIPIANFILFWGVVNFRSILNAFRAEVGGEVIFSFQNWRLFWNDLTSPNPMVGMAELLSNTLVYFSVNMFLIFPLSFLCSYFLYKEIRGYKIYRIVLFLPNIVSAAVLATLYKFMLNPSLGGIIPQIYATLTGTPVSAAPNFLMQESTALAAVLGYCIWTGFSVNLVLFNGAMSRISQEVIDAAKIDGVGVFREIFQIIIPLVWSTISTLIITGVANVFIASGPLLLLTGGDYGTNSISFWIFQQVQGLKSPYYPATVGFIFTCISLPLVLGVKFITERFFTEVQY